MRKNKIIASMVCLGGLASTIAPITMLSSCGSTSSELKVLPKDKLIINNGVLSGIDVTTDLSQYDRVEIPDGVLEITNNAFKCIFTAGQYKHGANNKIKELSLPHGLWTIGESAFEGCTGIEKIDLSRLDEDDLRFVQFTTKSNGGNSAFKDFRIKGSVVYNGKISDAIKKQFGNKLIYNGLSKYWVNDEEAPNESETHIVSINDFHGAAPGFGDDFFATNQLNAGAIRLAQESQEIIAKYPGSTFLSCGDYNAGESFSTCKQAETLYPVVKAMNIQYSAVGNHAWEWGKENLENKHWDTVARTDDTVGNYFVSANILDSNTYRTHGVWANLPTDTQFDTDYATWKEHRVKWADPYKVLNMNGHKVCIIGLTTHDTMTDGNLNAIKDLTLMEKESYDAAVVYSQRLAKEELGDEQFNKIESFILLTHCECAPLGTDQTAIDPSGECAYLAKYANSNFDAILAAHSHRMAVGKIHNRHNNKDIWIGQAGQSGRYYLDTKLEFDDSKSEGSRLKKVSMELKTPHIEGQNLKNPAAADKAKGYAQMKEIVEKTIFPVVKETAKVYEEQKLVSKEELNVPVGTISNGGLPYYYTDHTSRSFGTEYMQSPTLIEPATVFAQRGQIYEFNKTYKEAIDGGYILPTSLAVNNLDSFKNGFSLKEGQTEREVLKNEVFSQNAFENNIHYGCLTKDQLIQYINYFLEGACRFDYGTKTAYNAENPVYYNSSTKEEIKWLDTETVANPKEPKGNPIKGTSFVSGCNQFYGISFKVKKKEDKPRKDVDGTEFTVYEYDSDLRIFVPGTDDFDQPDQWTLVDSLPADYHGYIPMICSSFTWQGGNAQNRMLHHWFDWNAEQAKAISAEFAKKIEHKMFSLLTRDAIIKYAQDLTAQKTPLDKGISELLGKTIRGLN